MLCNWNEREEVILVYATAIDIWSRWCSWLSRRSHNMIAPGARNLISGGRQFDPGTGQFFTLLLLKEGLAFNGIYSWTILLPAAN